MNRLLFFYSEFCPPCKFFKKEFIEPLKKMVGNEKIIDIDVEINKQKCELYGVNRTPFCVLVDDEKIINSTVGITDFNYCLKMLGGEVMKIEFLKECRDKNTNELYKVGQVVEFDKERASEILKAFNGQYAKEVKEVKAEKATKGTKNK